MSKTYTQWVDTLGNREEISFEDAMDILGDWRADCTKRLEAQNKAETDLVFKTEEAMNLIGRLAPENGIRHYDNDEEYDECTFCGYKMLHTSDCPWAEARKLIEAMKK